MKTINNIFKLFILCALFILQSYAHAEIKITYYIPDASGSPVAATDEQGNIKWRAHYKPFGEEIDQDAGARANNIGYTGHVHDRSTGLTYMRARYYDPVVGRFMGMDPAGVDPNDPRTFNRFAYANNNPYKYIDPDGRDSLLFSQYRRDGDTSSATIRAISMGGVLVALTPAAVAVTAPAATTVPTGVASTTGIIGSGVKIVGKNVDKVGDIMGVFLSMSGVDTGQKDVPIDPLFNQKESSEQMTKNIQSKKFPKIISKIISTLAPIVFISNPTEQPDSVDDSK